MAMRAIQREFKEQRHRLRKIFPRKVAFEMTWRDNELRGISTLSPPSPWPLNLGSYIDER